MAQTPTPDPIVVMADEPKAGGFSFATKLILFIGGLIYFCSNSSVATIFRHGGDLTHDLSTLFVTALTG